VCTYIYIYIYIYICTHKKKRKKKKEKKEQNAIISGSIVIPANRRSIFSPSYEDVRRKGNDQEKRQTRSDQRSRNAYVNTLIPSSRTIVRHDTIESVHERSSAITRRDNDLSGLSSSRSRELADRRRGRAKTDIRDAPPEITIENSTRQDAVSLDVIDKSVSIRKHLYSYQAFSHLDHRRTDRKKERGSR